MTAGRPGWSAALSALCWQWGELRVLRVPGKGRVVRVQPLSHSPAWSQYWPNQSGNTSLYYYYCPPVATEAIRRHSSSTEEAGSSTRWRETGDGQRIAVRVPARRGEVRPKKKKTARVATVGAKEEAVRGQCAGDRERFLSLVSGAAQGRANSAKNCFVCVVFLNFPRRLNAGRRSRLPPAGRRRCKNGRPERQLQQHDWECQLDDEWAGIVNLIHPQSVMALPRGWSLLLRRSVHAMPRQEH
jgi:hypothetical protein